MVHRCDEDRIFVEPVRGEVNLSDIYEGESGTFL
jgi:hypothetical protein